MSITVRVYVESPADRIVDYDEIRLYRDTTPTGAFTSNIADLALVATQTLYTYEDSSGTLDSWYVYKFRNSVSSVLSDASTPFKPGGGTLRSATFRAASEAGAAFAGVTSGASGASTLVDALLRDMGLDPDFLNGAWIRHGDVVRRTAPSPFATASGTVSIVRSWTPPNTGDRYEVFAVIPPTPQPGAVYSWEQAIRDGLRYCWFVDQVIVGHGDGETSRFPLNALPALSDGNRRRAVFLRYTTDGHQIDRDLSKGSSYWSVQDDDSGPVLVLPFAPSTGEQIVVEVARQPDTPYRPDDYITMPEALVSRAAVLAAFRYLNRVPGTRGNYTTELAGAISEFNAAYEPLRPQDAILQR